MKRVGLVTTNDAAVRRDDVDTPLLAAELNSPTVSTAIHSWRDPEVDWSSCDLLVIRSPWDYSDHLDDFLAWLDQTSVVTRIFNCPDLIRWNLDKTYLAELDAHGITTVDSYFCTSVAETETVTSAIAGEFVLKPTVSAGSRNTGRYSSFEANACALAASILDQGKTVLVQPFMTDVATKGERALIFFDGVYSHAVNKGPLLELGGGLVGGKYDEIISAIEPTGAELTLATQTIEKIAELTKARHPGCAQTFPPYARIDLVQNQNGKPAVLEAELFEPSLFLSTSPGATQRFTEAILKNLLLNPAR